MLKQGESKQWHPWLGLAIETTDGRLAWYPPCWYDPITKVGLVEPVELKPGDVRPAKPDPTLVGREQSGRRPVLVVSNDLYLATMTTLALVVPLTTGDRGWDNHVRVDLAASTDPNFAMTEQIRVVARQRLGGSLGSVSPSALAAVRGWIGDCLEKPIMHIMSLQDERNGRLAPGPVPS